jgi:hypothetical protein
MARKSEVHNMDMPSLKRVKLHFAGLKVESTDRDRGFGVHRASHDFI